MKLSHSLKERFNSCSMSYKLHYIDRIRPVTLSSALVFGSALDVALNSLLIDRDLEKSKQIFLEEWAKYKDTPISYFSSDLDIDVIEEGEHTEYNSMKYKGLKMLEAYNTELLPEIKKVIEIQKEISLVGDSQNGKTEDSIVGFIDLVAEIEHEGQIVTAILDNKSTSRPYPKNCVETKEQTALYTYATGIEYAGFLTINKKTFKTQKIVGKVPHKLQEEVIASYLDVLDRIKTGEFEKLERKKCWFYGKKCDFYGLCWNNSMDGLVKKAEDVR